MCEVESHYSGSANSTVYFRDGYLLLMKEEGISILNLDVAGCDCSVRWSLALESHVRERKEECSNLMNFQGQNDKRF